MAERCHWVLMKHQTTQGPARPGRGEPATAIHRGTLDDIGRFAIENRVRRALIDEQVVPRVTGNLGAFQPYDPAAEPFLLPILRPRRHDDDLVARRSTGSELLIEVGFHPAALFGVEFSDVHDLHRRADGAISRSFCRPIVRA